MKLKYNKILGILKNNLITISDEEVRELYEKQKSRIKNNGNLNKVQQAYNDDLEEAYSHLDTAVKRERYYKIITMQAHNMLDISAMKLTKMSDAELEKAYQRMIGFYEYKEKEAEEDTEKLTLIRHYKNVLLPIAFARLKTQEDREKYLEGNTQLRDDIETIQKSSVSNIVVKTKKNLGDPSWQKFDKLGREIRLYLLGRLEYQEVIRQEHMQKYLLQRRQMNFKGKVIKLEELRFYTIGIDTRQLDNPEYAKLFQQMVSEENILKAKERAEAIQTGSAEKGVYLGTIKQKELIFSEEEFVAVMKASIGMQEDEKEKKENQRGEQ